MKLTEKNFAELIVENNGLSDGIDIDVFKFYFNKEMRRDIKRFARIRNNKVYPNKRIWTLAIKDIIQRENALEEDLLKSNKNNIDIFRENKIGQIEFESYLSKRAIKSMIDSEHFDVIKDENHISIVFNKVCDKMTEINNLEEDMIHYLNEISYTLNDTISTLRIKSKKVYDLLLDLNLIERKNRNIFKLSEKTLEEIFMHRLYCNFSSIDTDEANLLKKKFKIIIVNTCLPDEKLEELIPEVEKKFNIVKQEKKKNLLNEKFTQFILQIKKS